MDTKKFKMNLLNAEEMKGLAGGAVPSCSTGVVGYCAGDKGDAILDNCKINDLILCATYEIKGGTGTSCNSDSFVITCPTGYTNMCIRGHVGDLGCLRRVTLW